MFNYMTHAVTAEEIDAAINKENVTVLLFSAPWCGDCVFANTFMENVMKKYSDMNFLYVNRDDFMNLCEVLGIMGIPSFVAFKAGKEVGRFVSRFRKTEQEVCNFLDTVK